MKIRLLLLAAAALALASQLTAQTATVIINRTGGTAIARATGVRMVYTDVQPAVDANGLPTAKTLPGQIVADTETGNNVTSMTATGVPLKKLWFTWQAFNADGSGGFMRPIVVDLSNRGAPGVPDGTLVEGTITVAINVDANGKVTTVTTLTTPDGSKQSQLASTLKLPAPKKTGIQWPWSKKEGA